MTESPSPTSSETPVAPSLATQAAHPKETARILYVEDEEDYRMLVKDVLESAGLEVITAETGKKGLERLLQDRPGALILDINLPDTDGYAICRQLRQDPAYLDLPILMLTVRRRPEEWLRGFSSGANDYVSKPIDPVDLVERVVNCLEGKSHRFTGKGTPEYNLIRAAVAGNRSAFEVLIQQYRDRLIGSLQATLKDGSLVEDIVSQAFTLAFEELNQFRGEASFYTWVYRIALRESARSTNRTVSVSLDQLTDSDEGVHPAGITYDTPDKSVADQDLHEQVLAVLEKVPEQYRSVLDLYFLQHLSYESIAKKLDIPVGTVMSRLFKARKLLQNAWHRAAGRRQGLSS